MAAAPRSGRLPSRGGAVETAESHILLAGALYLKRVQPADRAHQAATPMARPCPVWAKRFGAAAAVRAQCFSDQPSPELGIAPINILCPPPVSPLRRV
jgi:hypothetical protein